MKRRYIFAGIIIVICIIWFYIFSRERNEYVEDNDLEKKQESVTFNKSVKQFVKEKIVEDYIQEGDTLYSVLKRQGVDHGTIQSIINLLKKELDLRKIKQGTKCKFAFDAKNGSLRLFSIKKSIGVEYVIKKGAIGAWSISEKKLEKTSSLVAKKGMIEGSFWHDARKVDIPPKIILDFADLFSWRIDFAVDLRKKDEFKVIFTKNVYKTGEVEFGEIGAAFISNSGHRFYAFRFHSENGYDYFDEQGNSVRHSFLKSPLRYRYISSTFTKRRFHPILKIYRPHLGVDYAAPMGTPISALGDGVICFKGWKGGFGKYLEIKHGDGYVSCYGHMSKFAKGIKKGDFVHQGQIIGYVGSTGLSTGPHLDFRMKYRGRYVNPLEIKSPPTQPIDEKDREEFNDFLKQWKTYLDAL